MLGGSQVLLKTSLGDLDIELWPKEAPMVRWIARLCCIWQNGTVLHLALLPACGSTMLQDSHMATGTMSSC